MYHIELPCIPRDKVVASAGSVSPGLDHLAPGAYVLVDGKYQPVLRGVRVGDRVSVAGRRGYVVTLFKNGVEVRFDGEIACSIWPWAANITRLAEAA